MQRDAAWFAARCGKITGSRFADALAISKRDGKPLKAWHDLVWDVAVERISGSAIESADAFALKWGREVEPYAREAYELQTGNMVSELDFINHESINYAGCSPDGIIDDDGAIEIKCPLSPREHLQRFLNGTPEDYIPQIQGLMWVSGRKWVDFVSYHPKLDPAHRILIIRHNRDDDYIDKLALAVQAVDSAANEILSKIGDK